MAFYRALADKQDQIHDPLRSDDTWNRYVQTADGSQQASCQSGTYRELSVTDSRCTEETKFGFSPEECKDMLHAGEWKELSHVRICGLMGMASNTDDVEQINREFCLLNRLFQEIKANWFADSDTFRELSMGMSHDYHEAIAAGSTLVRVGSKIFGERNY